MLFNPTRPPRYLLTVLVMLLCALHVQAQTTLTLLQRQATVTESSNTFFLTVRITNPSATQSTTAQLVLVSGDPADLDNFTTQNIVFEAGNSEDQLVGFTLTDDAIFEPIEIFEFELQNIAGGNNALAGSNTAFTLTVQDNEPVTTLFFATQNVAVNEGDSTAALQVNISNPSATDTTFVSVMLESGDSTQLGNFTKQTLHFLPDSTTPQTFRVPITQDEQIENTAFFYFRLVDPSGGNVASVGLKDSLALAVFDDDDTTYVRMAGTDTLFVNEGNAQVQLPIAIQGAALTLDTRVQVVLAQGDSLDLAGPTLTEVAFKAGDSAQVNAVIALQDDALLEPTEALVFKLRNASGGKSAQVAQPDSVVVVVIDNDEPTEVFLLDNNLAVAEDAGLVTFAVGILNASPISATQVTLALQEGASAVLGGFQDTTITFAAGATQPINVTLPLVDNDTLNAPFALTLAIAQVQGGEAAQLGSPTGLALTITDNEKATQVNFGSTGLTASENESTLSIPITITNPSATQATYGRLSLLQGAQDLGNFEQTSFLFPANGSDTLYIQVPITDDDLNEGAERFVFALDSVGGGLAAMAGANNRLPLVLADNETFTGLFFTQSLLQVAEGDSIALTVGLQNPIDTTLNLELVLQKGQTADLENGFAPTVLTFEAGSNSTQTVYAVAKADGLIEGPEKLTFALTNLQGASSALIVAPDTLEVTITDGDFATTVGFFNNAVAANEADNNAFLSLAIEHPSDTQPTVAWVSLTNADNSDFEGFIADSVVFPVGSNALQVLAVPLTNDALVEGIEAFSFTIDSVSGGNQAMILPQSNTATLTLVDDEQFTTVSFVNTQLNVEEAADSIALPIAIQNPNALLETRVNVVLSSGNRADVGQYSTQTVRFPAGQNATQTLWVPITEDELVEGPEQLVFSLQNARGSTGASIGSSNQVVVNIADNDLQSLVSFNLPALQFDEGDSLIQLPVHIQNQSASQPIQFSIKLSQGDTADLMGFEKIRVTAPLNQDIVTVVVPIKDDAAFEEPETFVFTLDSISGGIDATLDGPDSIVVTLVDNELPTFVQFNLDSLSVLEQFNRVDLPLGIRNAATNSATLVTVSLIDSLSTGSAADLDGFDGAVATFEAGNIGQVSVPVNLTDDDLAEPAEYFTFGITRVSGGNEATLNGRGQLVLTIQENTVTGLTVQNFEGVKVYPNPVVNNWLHVSLPPNLLAKQPLLVVYSTTGQRMHSSPLKYGHQQLNTQGWQPGHYLVFIQANSTVMITPIMVTH